MIKLNVDASVECSRRRWNLTLVGKTGDRSCWFEVSEALSEPSTLDFALVACVHRAMVDGQDLHLVGTASHSMLANLEHYIEVWSSWLPHLYSPIGVSADKIDQSVTRPQLRPPTVQAFSGGLDSSATLIRQVEALAKRSTVDVRQLMLIDGFDLPLDKPAAFARARASVERQTEQFGLPISVVSTDWKQTLCKNWEMEHLSALASCLHLHAGLFPVGLFAVDDSYASLKDYLPWSNNPVSNPLLSGAHFEVRGDGAALTRFAKAELVSRYPEIRDNLRVCWAGPLTGANCGRCEKCVRTQLDFLVKGLSPGRAFPRALTMNHVLRIENELRNAVQLAFVDEICAEADRRGLADERIEALRAMACRARGRLETKRDRSAGGVSKTSMPTVHKLFAGFYKRVAQRFPALGVWRG